MTRDDKIRAACDRAERLMDAFELATAEAVARLAAAGISTVGRDEHNNIVRREHDGTKVILFKAEDRQPPATEQE
jgi:hypothetical protein